MKGAILGSLGRIFGVKKTEPEPKDTPKMNDTLVYEFMKGFRSDWNDLRHLGNLCSNKALTAQAITGPANNNWPIYGTNTAPGSIVPISQQQMYQMQHQMMNQPQVPVNPLNNFFGLSRERLSTYLSQRSEEAVRGRYEKNFLTEVLGMTIEELRNDWFMIKNGAELTNDVTLCSAIHGIYLPLVHLCNKGGKFYSKTATDMANSKIWCNHCEAELPEDLFTMIGITYVL